MLTLYTQIFRDCNLKQSEIYSFLERHFTLLRDGKYFIFAAIYCCE